MIARAATAQDDEVGDGTTSNVLFLGELLKFSERFLSEGIHPRNLVDGIENSKKVALDYLEKFKSAKKIDNEVLTSVARTSLNTKIGFEIANKLVGAVVDAVNIIQIPGKELDLHMVEIMHMKHKMAYDTKLVRGIVMDHGGRHPDMPKKLENCYLLTLNVSLEYEKTEVNSQLVYSNAEMREKLAASERAYTDEKCQKIVDLKNKVCTTTDKHFVVVNQKGIDPMCLDMFAKNGVLALRRAKRRNMERLTLAFGGNALNSIDDMTEKDLGFAKEVSEVELGDDKYTTIEGADNLHSCTILVKGPNDHTINQIKDAIRDGLMAVKNTLDDQCVIPGAGAYEIGAYNALMDYMKTISDKSRYGIEIFANALLVIPRTLAENGGFDAKELVLQAIALQEKEKKPYGVDVISGKPVASDVAQIFDNYCVKRQLLNLVPALCEQLLLVDEVIRAGKSIKNPEAPDMTE
jgi:T-complex protein 1 subunit zeta